MTVTTYCTLGEAKETIGIRGDSIDDGMIDVIIVAASRNIDAYTGRRQFYKDTSATARTYTVFGGNIYADDFWTATGLIVKTDSSYDYTYATTLSVTTDYVLRPTRRAGFPYSVILSTPGTWLPCHANGVQVTAQWGWDAVPTEVNLACRLLTQQLYRAKDAPFGVAGVAELGLIRIRQNSVVCDLLEDYRVAEVLVE